MTTLAEIEAAVSKLKPEEITRLGAFVHELETRQHADPRLEEFYRRTGFYPLPQRKGGKQATDELVRQIREEEGI